MKNILNSRKKKDHQIISKKLRKSSGEILKSQKFWKNEKFCVKNSGKIIERSSEEIFDEILEKFSKSRKNS